MNTLELDMALNLREEAQDGYLATLYGRAVPYGEPTMVAGMREQFASEAFDPADVIGKPLAWRHEDPIGVITAAHNREDGLYITANIVATREGRDANALLRAGAVKGLSIGFIPKASTWLDKAKTSIKHTAAQALEVSLTHKPAYATAGVSAIREEEIPMSEQTIEEAAPVVSEDPQAREAIASVREEIATLAAAIHVTEEPHPLAQYRSLQEYAKAIATGVEERAANVSALSEQTGMVPPVWLMDIKGVLDRGRPCINALGGASSAGTSGLDIKWPKFLGDLSAIVAAQTNEGDEPNSADIDIVVGSATLATYASYNTLTWQVIDRADPSYVQAHARILMGAYGTETDYAFQAGLWANDVSAGTDYAYASDTDGSGLIAAVWDAATDVEFATGQPAEVVYVSANIWAKLPTWSKFQEQNLPIQNAGGSYNIAGVSARLGGLPVVLARNFATDGTQDVIVTNRAAVGWAEDGPRMVSVDKPSAGGRDVAIYGMGVITPFIANGIASIYNTP